MLRILARNWWLLLLRGIVAIIFGLLALAWPAITLQVLVILFGAYVLVDGFFTVITVLIEKAHREVLLLEGVAGIIVGVLTFIWPNITALVLLYLIAAWAFITGVFEIIAAVRLRKDIEGEWLLGLGGILSVIFGVLLAIRPTSGALAVIWIIGAYAVLFGILLIILSLKLRGWKKSFEQIQTSLT